MPIISVSRRVFLLRASLLLLLLSCPFLLHTAAGQGTPAPSPEQLIPVYTHAEQMPELYEGGGEAALTAAIQQGVVLPFGTPVPTPGSAVVVRFVVGTIGDIAEAAIVMGLSPAVDAAVLNAVHRLPTLRPGQQNQRYVRVALTLTIMAPGAATPAQCSEAHTRWQQTAVRLPDEADTTFVRRVLPLSFAYAPKLLAYAWRPSAFGKQLFFSLPGADGNEYGTDLFVFDPFGPNTYAVQVVQLESMGDQTGLASLFFADTNGDGQKELLALAECSLIERVKLSDGEWHNGRFPHYRTDIWRYTVSSTIGRPQYQQAPERPDLDELPTAAAVREALAEPVRRPKTATKATPKAHR